MFIETGHLILYFYYPLKFSVLSSDVLVFLLKDKTNESGSH